jgi:hypothetical protein
MQVPENRPGRPTCTHGREVVAVAPLGPDEAEVAGERPAAAARSRQGVISVPWLGRRVARARRIGRSPVEPAVEEEAAVRPVDPAAPGDREWGATLTSSGRCPEPNMQRC